MVHRDVKPHNLMRTLDGTIKVLDFGLARLVEGRRRTALARHGRRVTEVGAMLGTPDYLAPEQVNDSHGVDIRADVYSLGGTLYFLLAGQVPFPGGSAVDKVLSHLRREPAPLTTLRPEVPAELAQIVSRMMARDPAQRYQTPAEVAEALAPFLTTAPAPLPEPEPPPPPLTTRPSRRVRRPALRRRPPTWALVAAAFAGLLVVVALTAWMSRRPGTAGGSPPVRDTGTPPATTSPRVVLILPSKDFWYPDYQPVRSLLEQGGARVQVAAIRREPCIPEARGAGKSVTPDLLLKDVKAADCDAVVFIGGEGVNEFFSHRPAGADVHRLIAELRAANRLMVAICKATPVLVDAGAFQGLATPRATGWPDERVKKSLKNNGIEWVNQPVVVCGPIITGRDPDSARQLVTELFNALKARR
jgi:putative intracellular protease/amidase